MKSESPQLLLQPAWKESESPLRAAGGDLGAATSAAADAGRLLWLDSANELYAPRSTNRIQVADAAGAMQPSLDKANATGTSNPADKAILAQAGQAQAPDSPPPLNRFEDEIKAHEQRPRPEDGSSVFIGSSTFARWTDLEKVFKPYEAHDLAFGGSTIPEINHYFDRLFNGYTPKEVIFYAGTNDIGELHHNGAQVFDDFEKFEKKFHDRFPKSDLVFVSISAAPSRLDRKTDFDDANMRIRQYMDAKPHCRYVDVTHVMGDHHGHTVDPNLFLPDQLHMTLRGYKKWEPIIRDALEHPDRKS